jgi:hypothetical protein
MTISLEGERFGLPDTPDAAVMVFLGGYPDKHDMWKHQVEAFGDSYHILSISTPDFDRPSLRRKWGYTPTEIVSLIKACIDESIGAERAFTLVTHDWGAYWGYILVQSLQAAEQRRRVLKLVALDVGSGAKSGGGGGGGGKARVKAAQPGTRGALWTLPYQWYFALTFWVGVRISETLAALMLRFFFTMCWKAIGPLGWDFDREKHMPRKEEEVVWWMCYPYVAVPLSLEAGLTQGMVEDHARCSSQHASTSTTPIGWFFSAGC